MIRFDEAFCEEKCLQLFQSYHKASTLKLSYTVTKDRNNDSFPVGNNQYSSNPIISRLNAKKVK